MEKFDKKTQEIIKRLLDVRLSILAKQPFYAMLLLHMRFALDLSCETSYTDGIRIAFNPDFLDELSDRELEFVLMHEALHAALGHPFRKQTDYDLACYDKACDIVVNSNILYSFNMDIRSITFKKYGTAIHRTPSNEEGYQFTVEEVYDQLMKSCSKSAMSAKGKTKDSSAKGDETAGAGTEDDMDDGTEGGSDGDAENSLNGGKADANGKSKNISAVKNVDGNASNSKGGKNHNSDLSDANVNEEGEKWFDSNDYDLESLLAELQQKNKEIEEKYKQELIQSKKMPKSEMVEPFDDHSFWNGDDEDCIMRDTWNSFTMQATTMCMEKAEAHKGYGGPPLCAQRMIMELTQPQIDWRAALNEFVQEEVNDYSFSPPDKRMDDSPFFLPDFNEKDERIKNVWFLIDTSGSIGDRQIAAAYSEIISAMDMFDNKLEGLLSFTEVFVTEPIPFCDIEELLAIKPVGGGGNDFGEIFRYMQRNMMDDLPTSIVILTDGYDFYPPESEALGIPVFWLINNEDADPPPWGKWARFKVDD